MKKRIQMTLDDDVVEKADFMAKSLGMNRSAYISFLVKTINDVAVGSSVTPKDVTGSIPSYQQK